jgi:hypothetical protein
MDSTRQIYWNVSHAAVLPMYLLAMAAFVLFGYGFLHSARIWLTGKELNRLDHLTQRARQFFVNIMGHGKVRRASGRGLCHALFFWCFLILFAGTLIIMCQVDFLSLVLHVNILSGYFYKGYSLLLDLAGLIAICMLVVLIVYKPNYKRKDDARNNILMLVLLFLVLSTGFVVEGLRIAATEISSNASLALYSPVGLLIGQALFSLPNSYLVLLHRYLWWVHCALSLGAIAFIPYAGLRHVLLLAANIFLERVS